jgi:hypothetical protein
MSEYVLVTGIARVITLIRRSPTKKLVKTIYLCMHKSIQTCAAGVQ